MSYYRDNLIGKGNKPGREITRGTTKNYVWSITADSVVPGRMIVHVRRAGERADMELSKVPNYVAAEILSSIASKG